jgi:signal recognition particle receptor subunit beta
MRALASRELFGAPLLVLANKQDAADAQPPESVQQGLALEDLKARSPSSFQPL